MRYLILFFILIGINLRAQEIFIIDAITKTPIDGVSVMSKLQRYGNISDKTGKLNISSFNIEDTLIIQHVAYQTIQEKKSQIKKNSIELYLKKNPLENVEILESKVQYFENSLTHLHITQETILNTQSTQTSDLLEKTIGISIQNSQNGGGSPNRRGMEANRLLIIVDGISLNNTIFRSGHLQNTSTINPIFLKNAEVLFGPASVAYGNGAMGGAILFNTKPPENKNSMQFIQQYESNANATFTSIIANYTLQNSSNISGVSLKAYGDLKMGKNRRHGFSNWGKEQIITEGNIQKTTAYEQIDFFHKSLFRVNKNNFLLFNSQYSTSSNINRFDQLNNIINGNQKYKYWYYGPQKRFLQSVRLKNYFTSYFADETVFTSAYQNIKESRHKQKYEDELINNRTEYLHIIDFKSDFLKQINTVKLNYGFDLRVQELNSEANLSNGNNLFYNTSRYPDGGTTVLDNAVYAQVNLNCTKNILLLAGSRYSVNSLTALFQDTITIHLPFTEISVQNESLSNSFQVLYNPNNKLMFNAAISNGFRNPNTDDIGKTFSKDDVSVIIPNSELSIEKSLNIELGIQLKIKNLFNIQIQGFQTQITDAIERREATLNGLDSIIYDREMMKIMMNTNIGIARIKGLNLTYELNINEHFSHNTIINFIEGRTDNNLPLAHIPPTNIISSIKYKYKEQSLDLTGYYNGLKKAENYDLEGVDNLQEATGIGNPSWFVFSLKYQRKIDKNLLFITGIHNIMDIHYKTFGSGISAGGRNISLSLQAKI
jgi:hemoglobin/transferrin/lactoferrin receptor protein